MSRWKEETEEGVLDYGAMVATGLLDWKEKTEEEV